jgi:ankyrin repeat protein
MKFLLIPLFLSIFTHPVLAATGSASKKTTPTEKLVAPQPASKISLQFFQALKSENFELMNMLLEQGADINCGNCIPSMFNTYLEGKTALMYAMENTTSTGNTISKSVRYLVEKGAKLDLQDKDGITAVMYGAKRGFNPHWSQAYQVIYLLENGANAAVKDKDMNNVLHYSYGAGYSPITSGAMSPYGGKGSYEDVLRQVREITRLSVEHGLNVNQQNFLGETPLHYAAAKCLTQGANILISMGADSSIKTKKAEAALDYAVEKATKAIHTEICNETVRFLKDPNKFSTTTPIKLENVNPLSMQAVPEVKAALLTQPTGGTFPSALVAEFQGVIKSNLQAQPITAKGKIDENGHFEYSGDNGVVMSGSFDASGPQLKGHGVTRLPNVGGRQLTYPNGEIEARVVLLAKFDGQTLRGSYMSKFENGTFSLCVQGVTAPECTVTADPLGSLFKGLGSLLSK